MTDPFFQSPETSHAAQTPPPLTPVTSSTDIPARSPIHPKYLSPMSSPVDAASLPPRPVMGAARLASRNAMQAQLGMCVQHPDTAAVRRCDRCQARMCATCDFAFDRVHVCPACVANPILPVSSRRFVLAIAGLACVGFATAILGIVMSGLWALNEHEAGGVFIALIFLPTIIGTIASCSAMNKQLGNHPLLWTSTVWNLAMVLILVVLMVIGNLKG
jgi:hypothetical protein